MIDENKEQPTNRFIQSIRLRNILSFGPDSEEIELQPLNVLIGPNASGKSNFIDAISLLKAAPVDIQGAIRRGGGIADWLWKRGEVDTPVAEITVKVNVLDDQAIRHFISFTEIGQRFHMDNERFYRFDTKGRPRRVYSRKKEPRNNPAHVNSGEPSSNKSGHRRPVSDLDPRKSILEQPTGMTHRAGIPDLVSKYAGICLFRDWRLDAGSPVRSPQSTDLPEDFLLENASNLGMVLNDLQQRAKAGEIVRKHLQKLFDGVEDFTTRIRGGTVLTCLREWGGTLIPANRISAGTLRYLCLLVILCHPEPPPLICLEEPELGLHPDMIGSVAELLIEASKRTQLIVTTHSEILVSALSEMPESILICEQDAGGTSMRRLEPEKLKEWLKEYSLGDLWCKGVIGGSRW